jgi:hypothetical protein
LEREELGRLAQLIAENPYHDGERQAAALVQLGGTDQGSSASDDGRPRGRQPRRSAQAAGDPAQWRAAVTMEIPPTLPAYRLPDGIHLAVFCPECCLWHFHGAGDRPGDGDGHRAAHCSDKSFDPIRRRVVAHSGSLQRTGYILREEGSLTREIRDRHVPRRGVHGWQAKPPVPQP